MNRVHKDSASFGLIKDFLADPHTMRIHSETTSAHQPNEASHARKSSTAREMSELELGMRCAFPMLRPRYVQNGQRLLLSAVAFLERPEVHTH